MISNILYLNNLTGDLITVYSSYKDKRKNHYIVNIINNIINIITGDTIKGELNNIIQYNENIILSTIINKSIYLYSIDIINYICKFINNFNYSDIWNDKIYMIKVTLVSERICFCINYWNINDIPKYYIYNRRYVVNSRNHKITYSSNPKSFNYMDKDIIWYIPDKSSDEIYIDKYNDKIYNRIENKLKCYESDLTFYKIIDLPNSSNIIDLYIHNNIIYIRYKNSKYHLHTINILQCDIIHKYKINIFN